MINKESWSRENSKNKSMRYLHLKILGQHPSAGLLLGTTCRIRVDNSVHDRNRHRTVFQCPGRHVYDLTKLEDDTNMHRNSPGDLTMTMMNFEPMCCCMRSAESGIAWGGAYSLTIDAESGGYSTPISSAKSCVYAERRKLYQRLCMVCYGGKMTATHSGMYLPR
jgi:hypothetical protein